jgi:hypothetical protein
VKRWQKTHFLVFFYSSHASAATIQKINLNSYIANFTTSLGNSTRQVFSPLGFQVAYNYRTDMIFSLFGNYSMLSSGKGILLQGISGGLDYSLFGGQGQSFIFPKNTAFVYSFPLRVGIYTGLTVRGYDLSSLRVSGRKFSIVRAVPDSGQLIGLETGIGLEGTFAKGFFYSAQTSYVVPYFITQSDQKGQIISVSAGMGTSF